MTSAALRRIDDRTPSYLPPEWRPASTGGGAVVHVLAHLSDVVGRGLERLPDRTFLTFLDAMGVTLLPPRAARVPLVFTVASEAPTDFSLPRDTQVAAVVPPTLPSSVAEATSTRAIPPEPVVFATDRSISLTRAQLGAAVSIVPAIDSYAAHTTGGNDMTHLFGDLQLIPHELYLGHDTLFELPPTSLVTLQVAVHRRGYAPLRLRWEYATEEGWLAFDPVIDQTRGLSVDGEIVLRKLCGPMATKRSVGGIESFWIRARSIEPLPQPDAGQLPLLETIRARVGFGAADVALDAAFSDGVLLDTSKDFMPFGPQPQVGDALTIACDEAFKRAGAQITLAIVPSPANAASRNGRTLDWEYSVGPSAWRPLHVAPSSEQFETGTSARRLSFVRPDDWAATTVGGEQHHWVRVRLASGTYGTATVPPVFTPPVLRSLRVTYTVESGPEIPDQCLSINRFDVADQSDACRWGRNPFQPLVPVPDRLPALYIGFTQPLPIGLVSLLFTVPDTGEAGSRVVPRLDWEHRTPHGWSELHVLDETEGLQRTGMLQFIGPVDLVADGGPAVPLHWIRAVLRNVGPVPELIPLTGLHLNAVWASHRNSVRDEVLGQSDGSPRQVLRTRHQPVQEGESVEVQEWRGTGQSWQSVVANVQTDESRLDVDSAGAVGAVWVKWHRRPNLYGSGPHDRHYTIERIRGLVRFGDGRTGMIPPPGAPVSVSYDHGAGAHGNRPADTVTQLQSAAPYVESVVNPIPASGGADGELLVDSDDPVARQSGVRRRGPQQLRHRDRAIACSDYEWLARQASPAVARAQCASGVDADEEVTVVVAPWGPEREPRATPELLRSVRAHLAARAPAAIAPFVRVVGARYQAISVNADVVVAATEPVAEIEERMRRALDEFLHPLFGGPTLGWQFGDTIHRSQIAHVLDGIVGVDRVTAIQLVCDGAVADERISTPADRLPSPGPHVLNLRVGSDQ